MGPSVVGRSVALGLRGCEQRRAIAVGVRIRSAVHDHVGQHAVATGQA